MFKRVCVSVLLAVLFLLPSAVLPFDKVASPLKEFENVAYPNLSETVVCIYTHGVGLGFWFDVNSGRIRTSVGTFAMAGKGTLIKSQQTGRLMILTAAHVVEPSQVSMVHDKIGGSVGPIGSIVTRTILVGTRHGRGGPAHIIFSNRKLDLALLEFTYTPDFVKPIEYKTSFTVEKLGEGDAVGVIVNARDASKETEWWNAFRVGKIVAAFPKIPAGFPEYYHAWLSLADFTMDVVLYPGDSGSPVIAWENGTPYIIGIARAYMFNPYTGEKLYHAARIDYLHLFLEAY